MAKEAKPLSTQPEKLPEDLIEWLAIGGEVSAEFHCSRADFG